MADRGFDQHICGYIRAFRPLAHVNLVLPNLVGQLLACQQSGAYDRVRGLWAFALGIALHVMIIGANEWGDRLSDQPHAQTLISGGSGMVALGTVSAHVLRFCAWVGFVAGAAWLLLAIGCDVLPLWQSGRADGVTALLLWLAGGVLVALYDGQPCHLSHRGGGEWVQSIGQGVVLPWLGFAIQGAGQVAWWPGALALATGGLLAFGAHLVTALPDRLQDQAAGKRSFAVRAGVLPTLRLLALAWLIAGGLLGWQRTLHAWGLAAWLALASILLVAASPWARASVDFSRAPTWGGLSRELWVLALMSTGVWLAWAAALLTAL